MSNIFQLWAVVETISGNSRIYKVILLFDVTGLHPNLSDYSGLKCNVNGHMTSFCTHEYWVSKEDGSNYTRVVMAYCYELFS